MTFISSVPAVKSGARRKKRNRDQITIHPPFGSNGECLDYLAAWGSVSFKCPSCGCLQCKVEQVAVAYPVYALPS